MPKVLFVVSEILPLIKTGGLADVAQSLPLAIRPLVDDLRVVIPGYREVLSELPALQNVAMLRIKSRRVTLLESTLPGSNITLWLIDNASLFDRPGNPYVDETGQPWPDNANRFGLFCRAACEIAMNRVGLSWQADIVHCNDWQTGLVPALLSRETRSPATLFTIHNLAYQGLFPYRSFLGLKLPKKFWHPEGLEFYGQLSFLKGGLVYSDRINTVSPSYANEIKTPEFGNGLDGLLRHREPSLSGILNGIDTTVWNPQSDSYLQTNFDRHSLELKKENKRVLLDHFNLDPDFAGPLIGCIGRLVHQKGVDLILHVIRSLVDQPFKLVLIGSGEAEFERALVQCALDFPERISVKIGYDEKLAHRIEAGADLFLMPSRFEPCGLNQMYSLAYGTLPIVHRTGGLGDTVVDSNPATIARNEATGIVFDEANTGCLVEAVKRALILYENPLTWQKIQRRGMEQDFSWSQSASKYFQLYRELIQNA